MIGIVLSLLMRFHLVWPAAHLPFVRGGIMTPEQYLALVTMHGTIMIFFVLTTAPQGAFGNYFLPLQIGAPEMAFPRLNMLSFWLTLIAFVCVLSAFAVPGGAPISGWTAYPPLSGLGEITGPGEGLGQTLWIVGILIFCVASLLGSLNFIATTIDMRAPGMTLVRMPLTVWAWFVTAILSLLAFSVLLAGGVLLLLDRSAGTSFFLPAGLVVSGELQGHSGGSPLLWQHLFWFFGHPEVYIAILPGMGVVSHVLANFSRKPVFGYRAMAFALCAIGFLGFLVWGHHMFVSGMNPYSGLTFSLLTISIGVPSAIKTFNWLGTLWGGKIQFHTPMLFAIGFVSFFITGGLSGIFLAQPAVDTMLHATYYVVAHFHIVMGVAAIFGIFAATYYWFPKMFGRSMDETLGKLHFWITFAGVYCIFMPMHFLGVAGGIRRYADSSGAKYLAALQPLHRIHHHRCVHHRRGAADFFLEFLPKPEERRARTGESLERDHAGMDHHLAASARQFRRPVPERLSRAVRIQRRRVRPRFPAAESGAGRRGTRQRERVRRNPAARLSDRHDHAAGRCAHVFHGACQRGNRAQGFFVRLAAARSAVANTYTKHRDPAREQLHAGPVARSLACG